MAAACSFSECEPTNVASRSTISGARALAPWSGACAPASFQARARPAARAVSMAANAAGASPASAVIARETVASEATGPYRPGSPRSNAMSARQSPPRANVTARSRTTLAGSWTANGLRQPESAADIAGPRPAAAIVSVNSTPPACPTAPEFVVSTWMRG